MKIQDFWSLRLFRLLLFLVMTLAVVNLCSSFLDISYQLKLYHTLFRKNALETTNSKKNKTESPKISVDSLSSGNNQPPRNTMQSLNKRRLEHLYKTSNEAVTFDRSSKYSASSELEDQESIKIVKLPYCELPDDLGPVTANTTKVDLSLVDSMYPEVDRGGIYTPSNCTARHSVAIFVPYRDREEHLAIFLRHIHPFLMKQRLEYGIYVIEQVGTSDFNKGILYNAMFIESQGLRPLGWDCYIFQDIDLLPLDLRNVYSCPKIPRHMSVAVDTLANKLMYRSMFGGVTALSAAHFLRANGYSNMYWGWGGEDDDMSTRLRHIGYRIGRSPATIARYTMLPHKRREPNPNRIRILREAIKNFEHDGLSNVKYDLVDVVRYHLYTLIQIDVDRYANDTFAWKETTTESLQTTVVNS